MGKKFKFEKEALEDIDLAYKWYEEQQEGVGTRFLEKVDEKTNKLSEKPDAYSIVYKNYRKAPMSKFPFNIYYSIKEKIISIIAVLHKKRNSDVFNKRVDKQDKHN